LVGVWLVLTDHNLISSIEACSTHGLCIDPFLVVTDDWPPFVMNAI